MQDIKCPAPTCGALLRPQNCAQHIKAHHAGDENLLKQLVYRGEREVCDVCLEEKDKKSIGMHRANCAERLWSDDFASKNIRDKPSQTLKHFVQCEEEDSEVGSIPRANKRPRSA